ncbi:hypothetical protein MJI69_27445, partial [Salmonella enterica subsp. enterica serovar Anatum]|nr:hypothetical protein [Salmonella enterica subsp. enterica serovar Anatum]
TQGGAKYLDWHNALYATGKVEGALTEHDVYTLAQHYLTPTQLVAVKMTISPQNPVCPLADKGFLVTDAQTLPSLINAHPTVLVLLQS